MSDPIVNDPLTQAIIVIGGVITTIITVKYKDKIQAKMRRTKPRDRLDFMFDGYERLIKELQSDIRSVRQDNERQHLQIMAMQNKINELEDELILAKKENKKLTYKLSRYENIVDITTGT